MNNTRLIKLAAVSGALLLFFAVAIGAFGAHALADLLRINQRVEVFETANSYHFYHAFGLLLLGLLIKQFPDLHHAQKVFWAMLFGCVIFSGSLYLLAVLNLPWLGAITPIGGLLLLFAWGLLSKALWQLKS